MDNPRLYCTEFLVNGLPKGTGQLGGSVTLGLTSCWHPVHMIALLNHLYSG